MFFCIPREDLYRFTYEHCICLTFVMFNFALKACAEDYTRV